MTTLVTRRVVLRGLKAIDYQSSNAGLWLEKYLGDFNPKEEPKAALVKQTAKIVVPEAYRKFYEGRWKQMLKDCGAVNPREVEVSGRMAVGLGADSVLETSIAMHRTYGVPYIPASALKGLARSYGRKHLEKKGGGGEWTREHTDKLFGKTDEAGYIIFFDALYRPDSGFRTKANNQTPLPLHPDVMTVHHPKYYQEGKLPPADWDDPTPIPFLSATGKYLLAVSAPDAEAWREITLDILERALKEEGIGAKSSSGYGRMKRVESV
jgi:CRISPR-associated protein Cmr6